MNRAAAAVTAIAIGCVLNPPAIADVVTLSQLPGARINSEWFRYINSRFGLAVDMPARGYRYEIPVNGSGLTLSSSSGVTITVYAHWVINLVEDATDDVRKSISRLFDNAVAETMTKGGSVEYSVMKDDFYVVSGRFDDNAYYERLTISPQCPAIFNSLRFFYPTSLERKLDALVTRMSTSLRATCQGAEGPARFN